MVVYYNSILINPSPISIKAAGDQGAAADVHRRGQIVATIMSIRLTGPAWQGYFHRIVVGAADTASVTYNGTTYLYVKNAQGDVV